jgi:UDP-2,3-diacylglucosamine pyrophosphatase LpxH
MQHIFSRWAKISRSQSSYKKLSPDFFSRCIKARSKHFTPKPDVLVLGHVHANIDSHIHGIRCISGPSWLESPNVLLCEASGQLNRKFITGKDVPLFHVPQTE